MTAALAVIEQAWTERWEHALAAWSRFTRLHAPRFCLTRADEKREGLSGSFAMIRLRDHAVVISLRQIAAEGLEAFGVEVLAHEIGHHVYCPGDLADHGRMLARMRAALPTKEHLAPLVANLWADLLINDRLQRSRGLDMAGVYRAIGGGGHDALWSFYMRIYEILWSLPRGTLATGDVPDTMEGDAQLGARVVRVYGKSWLRGASRFGVLALTYLLQDEAEGTRGRLAGWLDTAGAGEGGEPSGLIEADPDEIGDAIHPADDPRLGGEGGELADGDLATESGGPPRGRERVGGRKKVDRYRGIIEYGELLSALGLGLDEHEVAIRYYRERALPHLIRFPSRRSPASTEPQPEGLEIWEPGSPLQRISWIDSVIKSPFVVPGITTVERTYGEAPGSDPARVPLDLYIGIDCSGSMPNPRVSLSFPVLAGAIMGLSALRAGSRVKVVLSGEPGHSLSTPGFVRDEKVMLGVLTNYLGTGYAFGIRRLDETFDASRREPRAAHVLVITDQDIFSVLDDESGGTTGWEVARAAVARARGGGTFVLHMPSQWKDQQAERMRDDGWNVHRLHDWEELVEFARSFSRMTYEEAS